MVVLGTMEIQRIIICQVQDIGIHIICYVAKCGMIMVDAISCLCVQLGGHWNDAVSYNGMTGSRNRHVVSTNICNNGAVHIGGRETGIIFGGMWWDESHGNWSIGSRARSSGNGVICSLSTNNIGGRMFLSLYSFWRNVARWGWLL